MTVREYCTCLKREFDKVVGSFVNGKIGRNVVEGYITTILLTNPVVIKNFRFNRSKNAIPIVHDALEAAMMFSRIVKDEKLIQLLKSVSDNWEYLFSPDDLPQDVETSKQWNEMFDACYFFVDLAMKNGWYYISDNSKLFLVAKSLEEKAEKARAAKDESSPAPAVETPTKTDKETPGKPVAHVVVRVKVCDDKNDVNAKKPAEGDAKPPRACGKVHVNARPSKTPPEELKVYDVSVQRTYYGKVRVQAKNETEAIEIATGGKPMSDGTWASEKFQHTSYDSYLELCDMGDETVVEVKD